MNQIALTSAPMRNSRRIVDQHTMLNGRLAYFLLGFLALVPLPLGSNRPLFWTVSALLVGVFAAVYFFSLARSGGSLRFPVSRLAIVVVGFGLLCGFLVIQAAPLGALLGPIQFAPRGVAVSANALSLAPGATWLMFIRMAGYGLFFLLILQVAVNRERAQFLLEAIFFIIAAYAAFGLLELTQLGDTILGLQKWTYQGYATGTFINRNSYATFLAFGLVIGASLFLRSFTRAANSEDGSTTRVTMTSKSLIVLLGTLFVGAALLATQSRMGLFAGVIGSAVVIALGASKLSLRGRGWAIGLALLVLGVAVLLFMFGGGVLERVGSIESSADVRNALYAEVWEMIWARPWLGYGGGSFEVAFPLIHHAPVSADLLWDKTHSTYLALWSELGLVAGSIPMLIIAILVLRTFLAFWRTTSAWSIPLAAVGVVIAGALHSTVDFSLEIQADTYFFLAVLALGLAGEERGARQRKAEAKAHGAGA